MLESLNRKTPFSPEEWNQMLATINQTENGEIRTVLDEILDAKALEGEIKGEIKGKIEGKIEGTRSDIIDWLIEDYGPDANRLVETLETISELDVLKSILRLMRRAKSLEEIERGVDEILEGTR